MKMTRATIAILVMPFAFSDARPALSQVPLTLTYAQVQGLSAGLAALDAGSIEQCAAPTKPDQKPCPYVRSVPLLVAAARAMVAIEGQTAALNKAQATLRTSVLSDQKLAKGDATQLQARQVAEYTERMQELMDTKVQVYGTEPLTLAELDLAHNHLSAATLTQLAPLVPELSGRDLPQSHPVAPHSPFPGVMR